MDPLRVAASVSLFACLLTAACGGPAALGGKPGTPNDGDVKGAVGVSARVIGRDGGFLVVGNVVADEGDKVTVQWPSSKSTAPRSAVAAVVPLTSLEVGQRVIASTTASERNARVGTVVAAGMRPRVKWDLDDSESEIDGGSAARLVPALCQRTEGCKHGAGEAAGPSAAALPGVKVGSIVAVSHAIKGAQYWSVAKVLALEPEGLVVDARGTGEIKVRAADVRLPATREQIVPNAALLFGAPPGGLAPGYVVRLEGDTVEMSYAEGATSGVKVTLGKDVFQKP